nr:hypothetical protein [Tanacetum cinerariifolium]
MNNNGGEEDEGC